MISEYLGRDNCKINPVPSPASNGDTNCNFKITWKNLSYFVEETSRINLWKTDHHLKQIINDQNGTFASSNIIAILGPSGSGKSTFLNIMLGKSLETNIQGKVGIVQGNQYQLNVSYINQNDHLTEQLTLREALLIASRLKNPYHSSRFHLFNLDRICKLLPLQKVMETRIGKCSGGQKRWISIALELMSSPNILILDEPTTGLDSVSTKMLIQFLKNLVSDPIKPTTVIATIHQPSANVFNSFDQVYIVSKHGQCIYDGKPERLANYLSKADITCPNYYNPADFITEIAAGEYGVEQMVMLTNLNNLRHQNEDLTSNPNFRPLLSAIKVKERAFFHDLYVLIYRMLRTNSRDPFLIYFRFMGTIMLAVFHGLTFGDIGSQHGCIPNVFDLYTKDPIVVLDQYKNEAIKVYSNLSSIFFCALNFFFMGMTPVLLFFPKEFKVVSKQYTNGWHSIITYFIAKTLTELLFMVSVVFVFMVIWYNMTHQIGDLWRFWAVFAAMNMFQIYGYVQGTIFSVIYHKSQSKTVYMGILSMAPFMLLSGFLVRTYRVTPMMRIFTYLSYFRYGFETIIISLYGYDRCVEKWVDNNSTESVPRWIKLITYLDQSIATDKDADSQAIVNKFIDVFFNRKSPQQMSIILDEFQLSESNMPVNCMMLVLLALLLLSIAYRIMYHRIKHS